MINTIKVQIGREFDYVYIRGSPLVPIATGEDAIFTHSTDKLRRNGESASYIREMKEHLGTIEKTIIELFTPVAVVSTT